jgi:hypothetical protein
VITHRQQETILDADALCAAITADTGIAVLYRSYGPTRDTIVAQPPSAEATGVNRRNGP